MTGGMGLLRAMSDAGALKRVTYVGGNSGGNWLLTQLLWSQEFYSGITGNKTLTQLMTEWNNNYEYKTSFTHQALTWITTLPDRKWMKTKCPLRGNLWDVALKAITGLGKLPVMEWQKYTDIVLDGYIPDIASATYAKPRHDLLSQEITYVQQVSVPPSAWSDADAQLTLNVQFNDSRYTAEFAASGTMALPAAHYSTSAEHGWLVSDTVNALNVRVSAEAQSLAEKLGKRPTPVADRVMTLPENPTISSVTASSSAAIGALATPSVLESLLPAPRGFKCFREAVRDFAVGADFGGGFADVSPTFRLVDGGFTDNTALAFTISKVLADCGDCAFAGKFIHFDVDKLSQTRVQALFTNPVSDTDSSPNDSSQPGKLVLDADVPGGKNSAGFGRPVTTIFANRFPPMHEWTPYADIFGTTSYYWKGRVRTVENQMYNIKAGRQLDLLVFALQLPAGDSIITPGHILNTKWWRRYGPIADSQAVGAKPIIEAFVA